MIDFRTVNTGFAIAALVANALLLLISAGFILTRFTSSGRAVWHTFGNRASPFTVPAAWIVGTVCTCASLFLQFGEGLIPCDLCWFQRIAMYPQAVILGIAVFMADRYYAKRYMGILAAIGACISVVHIFLPQIMGWLGIQVFPGCSAVAPCQLQPFRIFGFVSIPYMALSGFLLIIALLLITREEREDLVQAA